jgi:ABC-type Mn2+/Zn2+ transport system permease subunit
VLILSSVWIVGGALVGALALAAALAPGATGRRGHRGGWRLIGVGALAGVLGGWAGTLVFGRFFGDPTAAWVAVLAVVAVPRAVALMRRRGGATRAAEP